MSQTENTCPHYDAKAYATGDTLDDLSYHAKRAKYRLDKDGSIFRYFAGDAEQPDLLVCEHVWPFERKMFVRDMPDVFHNSEAIPLEYVQQAMMRSRDEAEASVLVEREKLKNAQQPVDAQRSGLQLFKGDAAVAKLDLLWAEASKDQDRLEEQNPDISADAAGTFVLHFPLEEACPSSRSGMSEAGDYDEVEILRFATMVVLVSKRNWMYFFDTEKRIGIQVQVRKGAYVPGIEQPQMDYVLFSEPTNGWLQVPIDELVKLGIKEQISESSPAHRDFQYLKEDCDMIIFMNAKKARGEDAPLIVMEVNDLWKDVLDKYSHRG